MQGEIGHPQSRQRRLLTGLEYDGVARGKRRGNLPGRHDHRIVPRNNDAHNTHRLSRYQCKGISGGGCNLVVDLVYRLPVPANAIGRTVDIDCPCILDWFSHIKCFGHGQLVSVSKQQVCEFDHDALALCRRQAAPAAIFKCRTRSGNSSVNIGFAASRHLRQNSAVYRRNAIKTLPVARGHTLSIDDGPPVKLQFHCHVILFLIHRQEATSAPANSSIQSINRK